MGRSIVEARDDLVVRVRELDSVNRERLLLMPRIRHWMKVGDGPLNHGVLALDVLILCSLVHVSYSGKWGHNNNCEQKNGVYNANEYQRRFASDYEH